MGISDHRGELHDRICREIIRVKYSSRRKQEYLNFADGNNRSSTEIAWGIAHRIGYSHDYEDLAGQTIGDRFETLVSSYLEKSFNLLHHLRPGRWHYSTKTTISEFDQYEHLAELERIIEQVSALASSLGTDYIVKPDIVVSRWSVTDDEINQNETVISEKDPIAALTPFRQQNLEVPRRILHASISCKWTIRSDRTQNARTEALNLIRNRKGHTPHIVAVTAEPLPTRIAALALGTGDLDCVYHFALHEMQEAIRDIDNQDQQDMLAMLVEGRRLRDISDLPFDIAI